MLGKISRLYHTIKPLKLEQIVYRLIYMLFPLKKISILNKAERIQDWEWQGPEVVLPSIISKSEVCFLNQKGDVSSQTVWNNPAFEKLWLYNLHYFDDLNAVDNLSRRDLQLILVKRWIEENNFIGGNGWEPYPLSLRLINLVKWYTRARINDEKILISMLEQAQALSKQLEFHILGNHLFANAKALVFIGCFFDGRHGEKYLNIGLKLLDREIPEQFLQDGGHFELSPMYHSILLWDLLDLINLAQISKKEQLSSRLSSWKLVASKALNWLRIMAHPDGEISFFNDATFGIAAKPIELESYGKQLGIKSTKSSFNFETLATSGYSRITRKDYTLIFDHAEIGPSYLPGHAHADTLSVELSIGPERVFVNSGTSLYGISEERHRQRGTAAHNTVNVDKQNSSEVWGGFRVARRANCILNKRFQTSERNEISATHNGYSRFPGKVSHTREIQALDYQIIIVDSLIGLYKNAEAVYHLHPDISVLKAGKGRVTLTLLSGRTIIFTSDSDIEIEHSTWHPGFGLSNPNRCLRLPVINGKLNVTITLN